MKEFPVEKNQQLEVEIIDLTHEGLGVAKVDHYPLFIENTLPGEIVTVHVLKTGKSFGYAKVVDFKQQSPQRVEIKDAELTRSGIAPLQHLSYEGQLLFKQEQIKNVLHKIAKLPTVPVLPTIGMTNPVGYRNKAQVPARMVNHQLTTGFYKKNSHELLPIENFMIQDPAIDAAIVTIRNILRRFKVKAYNEKEYTGVIRHIVIRRGYYSHEMMVVLVTRKKKFFNSKMIANIIREEIPEVVSVIQNINDEKTNVILGKEEILLAGQDHITDTLLGNTFQISAGSFYQVNTPQAEILYQTAIDFAKLTPKDIVVDAYCGIGTIGQSLAKRVEHVYGVEIIPEAINDAKENAKTNQLDNLTYEVGTAEEWMEKWSADGIKPTVIMVDPPRKGLTEGFIRSSAAVEPERIVYISCNPATLARDLKLYAELGYQTLKIQPVDLFPQTTHVECVVLMCRIKE